MSRLQLTWANSKTLGRISEIAVLTPVRKGCIPGERRTFEERLVAIIDNLAGRVQQGLPNELNLVSSIHFGRIMLIRPEQYLLYSDVKGVAYQSNGLRESGFDLPGSHQRVPAPIDEYAPVAGAVPPPSDVDLRSFLLTTVEFDGDLKVYFRDVDVFFNQTFDSLYENCENYPGTQDFEKFWLWIRRYQINTALFYSAYPNLSVIRIKQLELFKRRFDAFVASVRSPAGPRVQSMEELFDEFLRENQQIAFGFPAPGGTFEPNGEPEGDLS